jgi:hypothetical protein
MARASTRIEPSANELEDIAENPFEEIGEV